MIVQVKELPEPARRPLLVALSLQALATAATSGGEKEVAAERLAAFVDEFAAIVDAARGEGWVDEAFAGKLADHAAVAALKDAADRLWTIGLARLQQQVAAGAWYPDELELMVKPREETLVSRDHLGLAARRGGRLGFGASD